MKKIFYFIIAIVLSAPFIKAQDTSGEDFWLTFGREGSYYSAPYNSTFEIRIVTGNQPTSVTIEFINLSTSFSYSIGAHQIFTYSLDQTERDAVYNANTGVSNRSVHITANHPVTVYAMYLRSIYITATNILPTPTLGDDYYAISYRPDFDFGRSDAYAVIAIEDNTKIFHNGSEIETLDAGEVYYRESPLTVDMTGVHITANHPVALFACSPDVSVPHGYPLGGLTLQQLAPVKTWGTKFFVPVSLLGVDRVRIVVSEDDTNIEPPIGGTLKTDATGAQNHLDHLLAGQFVELEILLKDKGCYIESDKPVGVCAYLTSSSYNGVGGGPDQSWLPAIEQSVATTLMAPFIVPDLGWMLADHYALVVTPTATKTNTWVSVGGNLPEALSGGSWIDNGDVGMSFYSMPLTDETATYRFTNNEGLIILCYGTNFDNSYGSAYYYLAGSAMRDLTVAFSANGVPYTEMEDHLFCVNEITFTTNISNIAEVDSMKWYKQKTSGNTPDLDYILITDIVEDPPLEWTRTFRAGNYMIKLEVYHNGELEPLVYEGELCVGAHITIYPTPNDGGMTKPTTGCYKVGTQLPMEAYPY